MIYRSKYPLMFALILAAGMAGCIKEREIVPAGGNGKPVIFSPQVARGGESRTIAGQSAGNVTGQPDETRTLTGTRALPGHPVENVAGQTDAALIPDGKSFGVYAWVKENTAATVTNFAGLQNMEVTRNGSEYTYAPTADWPRDDDATLSFFAYYPYSDSADADESIAVSHGTGADQWMRVAYAVSGDAGQHIDLMYAKTSLIAGYDPVNLNFGHALARLKFEGRTEGYPAGAELKITEIRITGATLEGELVVLDPTTQPGKPFWELSDAPAHKGDMTVPAAHIKDIALIQTLQSVISTGGDMLVLPQQLGGMTVEVSATLNGTAFPQPFTFALDGTPNWTMNEITTYEITLTPDGMRVAARIADWTTDPVNVVYDGQYYMELSRDRLDFYKEGGALTLEIKTDYDKINAATGAAGSYLDDSGVGTWASVTDLGQTVSGGEYTRKVEIKAAAFEGTTDQTPGKIIVKAGNLNYVFHLTQSKDSWLTAEPATYYTLDGETNELLLTAFSDWEVAIKEGTNEPVSGNNPMRLITDGGKKGAGSVSFIGFDDINNGLLIGDVTVTLVFSDATGVNADKEVTVRLVACGTCGRAVPRKMGTRGYDNSTLYPKTAGNLTYLTHMYGDICWMVQNSKEGFSYSATTYTGKAVGERGYYYATNNAATACPDGWRLPNSNEITDLMNEINADHSTNPEGKARWWAGSEANNNGAFAGLFLLSNSSYSFWGMNSWWWYGTSGQHFSGSEGGMSGPYTGNLWAYSVRCVRQ